MTESPAIGLTYRLESHHIETRHGAGYTADGITCLLCGLTSWNPNDARHRYCANCHVFHDAVLVLYVITERPTDYPTKFVVRAYIADRLLSAAQPTLVTDTLDEARAPLRAAGLVRIERAEQDDPVILEAWI